MTRSLRCVYSSIARISGNCARFFCRRGLGKGTRPIMVLEGRIALVTGAFRGIERTSAEALAAEGARVIALDVIDHEPAYPSQRIAYRRFDVSSAEMWDTLATELDKVDILVNAAGITQTRSGLGAGSSTSIRPVRCSGCAWPCR
jgi:short chain dehydrogenase